MKSKCMNIFFSGQHGFNKRRKTKKMETATTRDQLKLLYGEGTEEKTRNLCSRRKSKGKCPLKKKEGWSEAAQKTLSE